MRPRFGGNWALAPHSSMIWRIRFDHFCSALTRALRLEMSSAIMSAQRVLSNLASPGMTAASDVTRAVSYPLPERTEGMNKCMVGDFYPVLDTLSYRLPEMNPDQNPGEPVLGCRLGETGV